MVQERYQSFSSFYPFYLSQHSDRVSRLLHFIGTALVITTFAIAIVTAHWKLLWLLPVLGYSFAWVGHFFFEKNKPATFQYPLYSLVADFVMFRDLLIGRLRF